MGDRLNGDKACQMMNNLRFRLGVATIIITSQIPGILLDKRLPFQFAKLGGDRF